MNLKGIFLGVLPFEKCKHGHIIHRKSIQEANEQARPLVQTAGTWPLLAGAWLLARVSLARRLHHASEISSYTCDQMQTQDFARNHQSSQTSHYSCQWQEREGSSLHVYGNLKIPNDESQPTFCMGFLLHPRGPSNTLARDPLQKTPSCPEAGSS